MGLISRSEATHRLKIVAANSNRAAGACRDGDWQECLEAAQEALRQLESLIVHIEEANDALPDSWKLRRHEAAAPTSTERVGGMGYRGHTDRAATAAQAPPKPIKVPKPQAPPTPPPAPEPEPEPVCFNLSRIAGRPEFLAQFKTGTVAPLTEDELKQSEVFNQLSKTLQEKIAQQYAKTGKPVYCKLKKSSN